MDIVEQYRLMVLKRELIKYGISFNFSDLSLAKGILYHLTARYNADDHVESGSY